MGKGTNYAKKPTLLDGIVLAGKLLKHTRDIIKNEKVFDTKRDFRNRLLIKIYETALDVNAKASAPAWRKARTSGLFAAWTILSTH